MPEISVAEIAYSGVPVGRLWTDNESVIEYMPVDPEEVSEAAIKRLGLLLSLGKEIGLQPGLAFASILQVISKDGQFSYEEATLPTLDSVDETQYFAVLDSDDNVIGLTILSPGEGDKVRENGQWVDPTGPDDERAFGPSVPVDESFVAQFDAGVTTLPANEPPQEAEPVE